MPEPSISVGDMLAYDLPLAWHEAVAVVQEVCASLFGSRTGAPDVSHVLLLGSGAIELLPEPPSAEPQVQPLRTPSQPPARRPFPPPRPSALCLADDVCSHHDIGRRFFAAARVLRATRAFPGA